MTFFQSIEAYGKSGMHVQTRMNVVNLKKGFKLFQYKFTSETLVFPRVQSCACNIMLEAEGRVTHSVCVCADFQNI